MNVKHTTSVVTRFAPSPTGFLHMGGVRTALFSYLYARKHSGTFVLRIEDTDKERSRDEWTTGLIDDLAWLGLSHDVFAKQSERTSTYRSYLERLINSGHAYISKETPTEEGQRDEVIRFKNPNRIVTFEDSIRGTVTVDTTDLGDFVIARSIDEPVYHFAVVVDDFEMGITHIIRAEEHLSNTPRQILIQEAIGAPRPAYAHLPLVLASDRSKLSKRKHGETVSLTYYRSRGYFPEAIINFVALIGWNPGTDQEILSMEELKTLFSLEKVQKGGAIFNVEKLDWINKQYLLKKTPAERIRELRSFVPDSISDELLTRLEPVLTDRISAYHEARTAFEAGEFDYLLSNPLCEKDKIAWKDDLQGEAAKKHLTHTIEVLTNASTESINAPEKVKELLWDYASEHGRGFVLWPIRYALTGKDRSPDPFVVISLLGKTSSIERLSAALSTLTS